MANKILIVYLVSILLFTLTGGLLIAFPLVMQAALNAPATVDTVTRNLILDRCPLTGIFHFPFNILSLLFLHFSLAQLPRPKIA